MEHWIQDYIAAQHKALESIQPSDIAQAYATLQEAWRHSRGIFIIGNGGNAANGSHFATDLGKGASDVLGRRFRVMSMADNTAWMTAIGNDYSYEETFTRQLQNFAKPGDVLIASSVSGNSPNLVHACEWAVQSGLETIALVGGKRGRLAEVAKQTIVIGDTHYGRVEDVQMHILHMLCYAFMDLKPAVPIEVAHPFAPRPDIQHVIFDFDGTLSLVREGWPVVMTSLFREVLPRLPGETDAALDQMIIDDIMRLNGKQTIYQMIQLADRIRERGGQPLEPLEYKHEYLRRLDARIQHRLEGLRSGEIQPDSLLVHQARGLLEALTQRGVTLHLASGTDEQFVRREADLLDVAKYFQGRIYGAVDNYKSFSKKMVIDRILAENAISGEKMLAFGDGYVEIQNSKEVGGLTVAVASDEANNGSGRVDGWKRNRLLGVGADIVIPDYRDTAELLQLIFGAA
ncbi:MAG: SIS domain-containing protein [Planctomycetota bacterium]